MNAIYANHDSLYNVFAYRLYNPNCFAQCKAMKRNAYRSNHTVTDCYLFFITATRKRELIVHKLEYPPDILST